LYRYACFGYDQNNKLLTTGEYYVKEAAEKSGFNDVKYFCRIVKKSMVLHRQKCTVISFVKMKLFDFLKSFF